MSDLLEPLLEFEIPDNLYVPSPPLWIESKGFKGPLDLLWYLIREQDIDILDIPVALIAAQYLQYIKIMDAYRFEIAPDYLVMAVRLMQIKSQLLLPKPVQAEQEDEDPRAFLVKQLSDYADIQRGAQCLEEQIRWYRDVMPIKIPLGFDLAPAALACLEITDLQAALQNLYQKQDLKKQHQVLRPVFSLTDKMDSILAQLSIDQKKEFLDILERKASAVDIALSFQASLELAKNNQIDLEQEAWQEALWLNRLA